ncbi:Urotensin-2B [Pteropus alecto]|uniref:Urotensin-2B n=1 Tax=Pteropus alecto TaxID=9402 RepID=L5L1X0_PTEAL|nr:Urotensin-2B [Pteropus alecto]
MNKSLSTTLCFGLLTLLSVMIFLESVHGRPYLIQDIELANKLEELNQLEKLKEQLMEAKYAEMSYAIDGLSPSHSNKRGTFSFRSLKLTSEMLFL